MRKISTKYILYKMCAHHAQHLCTLTMYINIMQCAKRYHPWNVSIICLYQHANMCIYQYANHVHLPTCQTMYHITHDMSPSWTKCHNHVSNKYQCCENQVIPYMSVLLCTNTTKWWVPYMYAKSSIKHVPIILPVRASTDVLEMYQPCITHRSNHDVQHDHLINSPTICHNM